MAGRADDGDLALLVTCTVVNTGDRPGKEVVQLFVRAPATQVARPVGELKAFAKIDLAPDSLVYDPGYALPEDVQGEVVNRRIDTDWYYRWTDWN